MLDYFALVLIIFVGLTLFYGIIVIHDIPYEIAKKRNHPQQDAIHVAGWISLFTLHVLWPFLWIWATLYREDRGWGFQQEDDKQQNQLTEHQNKIDALQSELSELKVNATTLENDLDNRIKQSIEKILSEQKNNRSDEGI